MACHASWAQTVKVETVCQESITLGGHGFIRGFLNVTHVHIIDTAALAADDEGVWGGHVRVVAIRPVTELDLQDLASGAQRLERFVDGGGLIIV